MRDMLGSNREALVPAQAQPRPGSKIKKEIPRRGFGVLVCLYYDTNPENFAGMALFSQHLCTLHTIILYHVSNLIVYPHRTVEDWR